MTRSRVVAVTAAACIALAITAFYSNYSWAAQGQAVANQVNAEPQANEPLEIAIGLKIAPVPLKYPPAQRRLVGLGSYIVNGQGGCNDCHTNPPFAPGGDPFMGEPTQVNAEHYLAGGMQFGEITSRNLTPRLNGRPAGFTFAQFRTVMRTGFDLKYAHPEISPLLQVMPWPVYRYMTDEDLLAVYTYLSAIPPATPGP